MNFRHYSVPKFLGADGQTTASTDQECYEGKFQGKVRTHGSPLGGRRRGRERRRGRGRGVVNDNVVERDEVLCQAWYNLMLVQFPYDLYQRCDRFAKS